MSRQGLTVEERWRRERRVWGTALGLSLLAHLAVFFMWRTTPLPPSPFAAAGPRAGDNRAVGGGGMRALRLRTPPWASIVPPLVPLPSVTVSDVEVHQQPVIDVASLLGQGRAASEGQGQGSGLARGTGRGDGGTAEGGYFRLIPPSPRGMIVPPSDKRLRGREIQVWVFVDEMGRVVPDSTRLYPPTPDAGLNRRLKEEAAQWLFDPAVRGGKPVAAWFPYTISM
ncbi:MAG: hypothetical protein HY704_10070 [Gemmatimonadetes bacterium]|nr:hypothetical protein [Gemmatimonadota bacterium]